MKMLSNDRAQATDNLDAVQGPRRCKNQQSCEPRRGLAREALSSVVAELGNKPKASRYITLPQAQNMLAAKSYAALMGRSLVAHATIHWAGTQVWDDHYGQLFAKVREGLNKWLLRHCVPGGLTGIWCRECRAQTDVVHCHLLFHLPLEFRSGANLLQTEAALNRLVDRHGGGLWGEFAVKLTIHRAPDAFQHSGIRSLEFT